MAALLFFLHVQVSAGEGRRISKLIEWQERSLLNGRNQKAFGAKETSRAMNCQGFNCLEIFRK